MMRILDYLNSVDADAKMQQAHLSDPLNTMKAFGLSELQCDAVMSGNMDNIAELDGFMAQSRAAIQVPHTGPGPSP